MFINLYFSMFRKRCWHSHTSSAFSQKLLSSMYCEDHFVNHFFDPKTSFFFFFLGKTPIYSSMIFNRNASYFRQSTSGIRESASNWGCGIRESAPNWNFLFLSVIYFFKSWLWRQCILGSKNEISNSLFLRWIPKCRLYLRGNPRFNFLIDYKIHGIRNLRVIK